MPDKRYRTDVGEFKGNKIIQIWDDVDCGDYPVVSFGVKKAKAILDCIDDIKKFVSDHEKKQA